jgi:hypothetical protein
MIIQLYKLKTALCYSVRRNLYKAKWGETSGIYCDASRLTVGSLVVQYGSDGAE